MQAETHNALAIIVKQLDDKILQLQEFISTGNLDKFEEYKKVCGEINGLGYDDVHICQWGGQGCR